MSRQSDPLIQTLIDRLRDDDPIARRNAAGALRLHGARAAEAIPALLPLLDDEDPRVRREAEKAVERLRTVAA